ncbi:MAG: hypothetical protein GDA52_03600 [Rhodobacteraceae bacterium]|nr:hypothetical protein [Paracoccaceae bacterium]
MTHRAFKTVIITEKVLADRVAQAIEEAGGTGYTIVAAGGKGSRGMRRMDRAAVVEAFSNIKIEVITADHKTAERIADHVAGAYFTHYSGIAYIEEVEVLRQHKFVQPGEVAR